MSYVDQPEKRQKRSHFENRARKLDFEFTKNEFQKTRTLSTEKKLIKSFARIGMCLNDKTPETIPTVDLDTVCFILCNTYNKQLELGIGPLNDGYMFGLNFHRFGYKIFYLHDSSVDQYVDYLKFFVQNTQKTLVVYYSGRAVSIPSSDPTLPNDTAMVFQDGQLSEQEFSSTVIKNANSKSKIVIVSDCLEGGTIFSTNQIDKENHENLNVVSFSTKVSNDYLANKKNKAKKLQGMFTYYFCRLINESPRITPDFLMERTNIALERFNETISCVHTENESSTSPIFE